MRSHIFNATFLTKSGRRERSQTLAAVEERLFHLQLQTIQGGFQLVPLLCSALVGPLGGRFSRTESTWHLDEGLAVLRDGGRSYSLDLVSLQASSAALRGEAKFGKGLIP